MCDCVKSFLERLEPIIIDLDERKEELNKIKEELDNVRNFLHYTENDIKKIGLYFNQKFIEQNLVNVSSDVSTYQAMVYLIETDNPSIKKMPQYQKAVNYMQNILEYFNISENNLNQLYLNLSDEYHYKSTAKKYYDLFQNDAIYVSDYNEFIEFFLTLDINDDEKKCMLSYVIKINVNYYKNNLGECLEIDREQELKKVQEIIYENKNLLSNEYNFFVEGVSKQVNLSLNIKEIITEDILKKIDVNNLILAKRIHLTNKITQSYKSCEFALVSKYIKEYDELMVLKEKIVNINNKDEIIRIVKGGY